MERLSVRPGRLAAQAFLATQRTTFHNPIPSCLSLSTRPTEQHFEVKLAAASAMCVAREPPSRTDPGTALFRRQDGAWIGDVTVPETGGPLFVWALLSADAAEIDASRGVRLLTFFFFFRSWTSTFPGPEIGPQRFHWRKRCVTNSLPFPHTPTLYSPCQVSGMRPSSRALLPNVKCAEFRVLETLGGWEDDLDVEESMMRTAKFVNAFVT